MSLHYPHTDNILFEELVNGSVKMVLTNYLENAHFCLPSEHDGIKHLSFFNGALSLKIVNKKLTVQENSNLGWYHNRHSDLKKNTVSLILADLVTTLEKNITASVERKLKHRKIFCELQQSHLQNVPAYQQISRTLMQFWLDSNSTDLMLLSSQLNETVLDLAWSFIDAQHIRPILEQNGYEEIRCKEINTFLQYPDETYEILYHHPSLWRYWLDFIADITSHAEQSDYRSLGYADNAWQQALYEYLLNKGLRKQAWKMLLRYPFTIDSACTNSVSMAAINSIAQCNNLPKNERALDFCKQIASTLISTGESSLRGYIVRGSHKIHFLNALIDAINQGLVNVEDKQITGKIKDALDFVRSQVGIMDVDHNQAKSSLQWWITQSEQWHAFVQSLKDAENNQWASLVDTSTVYGYEVVPLIDASMLYEEGRLMGNCLASYSQRCMSGETRVFSIRHPLQARPKANFDLQLQDGQWTINNVVGAFNVYNVDMQYRDIAEHICQQYNENMRKKFDETVKSAAHN